MTYVRQAPGEEVNVRPAARAPAFEGFGWCVDVCTLFRSPMVYHAPCLAFRHTRLCVLVLEAIYHFDNDGILETSFCGPKKGRCERSFRRYLSGSPLSNTGGCQSPCTSVPLDVPSRMRIERFWGSSEELCAEYPGLFRFAATNMPPSSMYAEGAALRAMPCGHRIVQSSILFTPFLV
jgi:hypothetical protein